MKKDTPPLTEDLIAKLKSNEYYLNDRKMMLVIYLIGILGFTAFGGIFILDWTIFGIIFFAAGIYLTVMYFKKRTAPDWIKILPLKESKIIAKEKKRYFKENELIEKDPENDKEKGYLMHFFDDGGKERTAIYPPKFTANKVRTGDWMVVWEFPLRARCLPLKAILKDKKR